MMTTPVAPSSPDDNDGDLHSLDLRGLNCPLPVLQTNRALKAMPAGAVLCLYTSDPRTVTEIPELCQKTGHHCLEQTSGPDGYYFCIRRGA